MSPTRPKHHSPKANNNNTNNANATITIHLFANPSTPTQHTVYTLPACSIRTSAYLQARLPPSFNPSYPTIHLYWHGAPIIFTLYLAFLRTRTIFTTSELSSSSKDPPVPASPSTYSDFLDLLCCWGLGKALEDEVFQDMVMSDTIKRLQLWDGSRSGSGKDDGAACPLVQCLTPLLVSFVWRETEEDGKASVLRKLVVDATARFGRVRDFEGFLQGDGYPLAFIRALLVAMAKERDRWSASLSDFSTSSPPPPPSGFDPESRTPPLGPGGWFNDTPSPSPPPFFDASGILAQQPCRILLNGSASPENDGRRVRFELNGVSSSFPEDKCAYHLHRQNNRPCWRAGL